MSSLTASGYVHRMLDEKQTFEEFVLSCARAFGALITMRDEPIDAPIPQKFEPSSYHTERLAEAKAKVAQLSAMDMHDRTEYGSERRAQEIKSLEKSLATNRQDVSRCREMLQCVQEWVPPTPEHDGLKQFMAEQLTSSIGNSVEWWEKLLAEAHAKPPMQWFADALSSCEWDVEYHTKEGEKEVKRNEERTDWVAQLRANLKG